MALYLGADKPLPLVAWDESAPAFHVEELRPEVTAIRRQFDTPHVYYAAAHEGCACGFQLDVVPGFVDAEAPAKRESLRRLADYLETQLALGTTIKFLACWMGDEQRPPEHRRTVKVSDLRSDAFYFLELEASSFVAG